MRSDKDFLTFLKGLLRGRRLVFFILVASLAVFLIFYGMRDEKSASQITSGETEQRIAELCSSVDGVGECRVMVTFENGADDGRVYSVVVVCEGADEVRVRREVKELVTTLFGIGSNRVSVIKLG